MSVADALHWFALRKSHDDLSSEDVVTLLTCHAAKGLEWPACIIVDLNERDFPTSRALKDPDEIAEERRVCYVAMTRAGERLIMHYRRSQDQAFPLPGRKRRRIKEPSRFLREADLFERTTHAVSDQKAV